MPHQLTNDSVAFSRQMVESERAEVKHLRTKGYSERQLQEMGFSELAVHGPTVALVK